MNECFQNVHQPVTCAEDIFQLITHLLTPINHFFIPFSHLPLLAGHCGNLGEKNLKYHKKFPTHAIESNITDPDVVVGSGSGMINQV